MVLGNCFVQVTGSEIEVTEREETIRVVRQFAFGLLQNLFCVRFPALCQIQTGQSFTRIESVWIKGQRVVVLLFSFVKALLRLIEGAQHHPWLRGLRIQFDDPLET